MINRPKMLNERQETRAGKIFSALCTFAVLLLVAFTVFNLWFVNTYFIVEVDGVSMENTLLNGDALYAKRVNFFFSAERGDVVVINVKQYGLFDEDTERVIKRLIAVEGDTVKCEHGVVWRDTGNGYEQLDEPYAKGVTPDFEEVKVGFGQIFFLGDNRPISKDSTEVGCLYYADIVGVVSEEEIEKVISKREKENNESLHFFEDTRRQIMIKKELYLW